MIETTIRWRQRLQLALRLLVFGAVTYTAYEWVDVVLYQAMRGFFGAALTFSYTSREFVHLATVLVFAAFCLAFERRLIRWMAPIPPRACHECGYSLEGLSATRCPECGAAIMKEGAQIATAASRQHE